MEKYIERYNLLPAAAWLRGHSLKNGIPAIRQELLDMPLEVLTDNVASAICHPDRLCGSSDIDCRLARQYLHADAP